MLCARQPFQPPSDNNSSPARPKRREDRSGRTNGSSEVGVSPIQHEQAMAGHCSAQATWRGLLWSRRRDA